MLDKLIIKGAREHNLKNIDLELPKNKLIVFTGLSGSGKSSLAFNTIYAEGERRYIESLSSFSRQFLKSVDKPDVDDIIGLSPAISIDQKTVSHNPRSTVGTSTEIFDYLRILYANIGTPYCINGHGEIKNASIKEIIENIKNEIKQQEEMFYILAPIISDKKGTHKLVLTKLKKDGFIRIQVDGKILTLDEEIELDQNKRHNIDLIIDRIKYRSDDRRRSRIYEAIEIALNHGNGLVKILYPNQNLQKLYSTKHACKQCGFMIANLEPNLFSFNKKNGACELCFGLGIKLEADKSLIIPNPELSIEQGAILYYKNTINTTNVDWQRFKALLNHYKISTTTPICDLSSNQLDIILNGSHEPIELCMVSSNNNIYKSKSYVEGIAKLIERRYVETKSDGSREYYEKYMVAKKCDLCNGQRLNKNALCVKINNLNIAQFCELTIEQELNFLLKLKLNNNQQKIADLVLEQLTSRLSFLNEVGLNYLTLARPASSLSGGESQRIRLAKQLGSKLSGVLYVLDEPSIGLHQKDNDKLISILKELTKLNNTLIVVEHDEDTIKAADWIVDIGPLQGENGGQVVFSGTYEDLLKCKESITAQYLNGIKKIEIPKSRRSGNGLKIVIKGAKENNLKNIDITIPLAKFIAITGVSGSGKSTLLEEIIYKGIKTNLSKTLITPGKFKSLKGWENLKRIVYISQDPIGKTPRSNPATYTSVFDDIRDLFASTPESKARGYKKGRFSFNTHGGRCENCQGDVIKVDMQFLGYVEVVCEVCNGKRYNEETLQIRYKGKNIDDVLNMSVDIAVEFFENIPKIKEKLDVLKDVGLGYIKLGQSSPTLSGGEAQRVKLATYLLEKRANNTMFLLDEPTTGLHVDDINKLINVLNVLIDRGNTVVVIEHNLELIKVVDYIIDLGLDGGEKGGQIIATGTPEQIIENENSYLTKYLKAILK